MRRFASVVAVALVVGAMGFGSLPPARAAAAATPPQSLSAVVGLPYNYEFQDVSHGTVAYSAVFPPTDCMTPDPDASWGLPDGLVLSTSGTLSGIPELPDLTEFCVNLVLTDHTNEMVPVTMTVGSGNAAVDGTLVPIGTQVQLEQGYLSPEVSLAQELVFEVENCYLDPPVQHPCEP